MKTCFRLAIGISLIVTWGAAATASAQTQEVATVDGAIRTLEEIMAVPARRIPETLIANAQGLAIIPNVVKGSFVIGVRHGKGVVVLRDDQGVWRPPVFISLTGGSLGWQAGVQATDVVLVFKSRKSIEGLMRGKFTIGADAAAAAGPLGREAAAATDSRLSAEILSYSRSRGLFAGVSLDGTNLQVDAAANQAYYLGTGYSPNGTQIGQAVQLPPSAVRLIEQVGRYTATPNATPVAGPLTAPVSLAPNPSGAPNLSAAPSPSGAPNLGGLSNVTGLPNLGGLAAGSEPALRQQLSTAWQQLLALLPDNKWREYLAPPAALAGGNAAPTQEQWTEVLTRYEAVARDPRYTALTQRQEFRVAHDLLRGYVNLRQAGGNAPSGLAPPPSTPSLGPVPAKP